MKNNLPNVFKVYERGASWFVDEDDIVPYKAKGLACFEFVPKEKLEESERNYREMFKTMTASVEGYKKRLETAVKALNGAKTRFINGSDSGVFWRENAIDMLEEVLKEMDEY